MAKSTRCPCGSGLQRHRCDPAPFAACACGEWFHHRSNSALYCDRCKGRIARELNRQRQARFRQRQREKKQAARAGAQLQLEDVA